MFGKYKTIKRLKMNAEKVKIPEIQTLESSESKAYASKKWYSRKTIRYAASVCLLVFILTVISVLNIGHNASKNNLILSVGAQDQSVVLKSQTKVTFVSGHINRQLITNNDTKESSYGYGFYDTCFICTGKDIETVSYRSKLCTLNFIFNRNEQNDHQVIIQMPDTYVYNWGAPDQLKAAFDKVWNSGQLDYYKNKYFEGKDINLDDYLVRPVYDTAKHTYTLILIKKINKNTNYNIYTNTIEVRPGDIVGWECWGLLNAHLPENNDPTPPDYSKLPHDNVTVTATFKNGQSVTETIDISFNKKGNMICELIGN